MKKMLQDKKQHLSSKSEIKKGYNYGLMLY